MLPCPHPAPAPPRPNLALQQTQVGSSEVRGISGGERKRLTTAEILVGQQPVLFMGEGEPVR